jgi:hypothetical protein
MSLSIWYNLYQWLANIYRNWSLQNKILPWFFILHDDKEIGWDLASTLYSNTIRMKIHALIKGGVKQIHFLGWLDVNSNSWGALYVVQAGLESEW